MIPGENRGDKNFFKNSCNYQLIYCNFVAENFLDMESTHNVMKEWGSILQEVYRAFKKRSESEQFGDIKLSADQFGLLHYIHIKTEEVIQQDMAEMMGKDKSAILRLTDSLEERGLVRRVTDLKDRRKNCLMVTKTGLQVLEQKKKILEKLSERLYSGISEEDLSVLFNVTRMIKNNAEKL